MFGSWGTKNFEHIRVETPDGPGVITSMRKKHVDVKLNRAPGRPRRYKKSQIRQVDTTDAEEVGGELLGFVAGVPGAERGAKIVLKQVFKSIFSYKVGY